MLDIRGTHLSHHPVEINQASREELLRIPGIGPKGARVILSARRDRRLKDLSMLGKLGILAKKASPYILLDGRRPERQLAFAGW